MKKYKIITFIAVLVIMFVAFSVTVSAYEIKGEALKSDIVMYINNYPIPSYNYNGYTFIAVEDLAGYGFNIKWNEYYKTLCIIRNDSNEIDFLPTFLPMSCQIGEKEFDMHTTNVRTFIGNYGYEIECYGGIPGYTFINVENLAVFGELQYVPELRHMKLWIRDGLECYDVPFPVRQDILSMVDFGHSTPSGYENYYEFNYYSDDDNFCFTFGEFSMENGEIIGYSYCDSPMMFVEVYNVSGEKVFSQNDFECNITVSPYMFGYTSAPVCYETYVPKMYLSYGEFYLAKVLFVCPDTGWECEKDVYFTYY